MGYDVRSFVTGQLQSMDSFETQSEGINLFTQGFLHFHQSLHNLSFIYTGDLIPLEDKSIPIKIFLTF